MVRAAPRVSIGLPTANRAATLAVSLDAILRQTFDDFEVVISDNASTDDTRALCQQMAARDPRIRYSRNEQNLGIVANFNRVIALARGEFFVLATDDDVWEPGFVESLVTLLDRNAKVTLAFSHWDWIDGSGQHIRPGKIGRYHERQHRLTQLLKLAVRGDAHLTLGVQRVSALRKSPGFLPFNADGHGADALVLFSHAVHGRIATTSPVLFHYRLGSNISRLRSLPSMEELVLKEVRYYANLTVYLRDRPELPGWQRTLLRAVLVMRFSRSIGLYNLLWASRGGEEGVEERARGLLRDAGCRVALHLFFPPGLHRALRWRVVRRLLQWVDTRLTAERA